MWQQVRETIQKHSNFLLATHQNPDGDGLGSAAALTELLLSLGKKVCVVTEDALPQKFTFLDLPHTIYNPSADYSQIEVMFILDTHRKARIGALEALCPHVITICIDHHPVVLPSDLFASYNVIDPQACSVGEMLDSLFAEFNFRKNLPAAIGIYTSVFCDTARFSNSTTTSQAHKIADECIKLGVDPQKIYSHLYQHLPIAQVKILAHALTHMETHLSNRVLIEQIYLEDCEDASGLPLDLERLDLEYIHEFNKLIEGVECVILLRELPDNHVRISLRSTSNLDISLIMRSLGGGGHSKAAGVTCRGSLPEVKGKILGILSKELTAGV